MTPSQTKSGIGLSKKPNAQVGWSLSLNPAVLCNKQRDDPDIGAVLEWKESGLRPFGPEVCASSPATRHYWNCWDLLQIQDGMLMHCFMRHDATDNHMQFIVPLSLHNEVLYHIHDSLLGGHLGQKKTREKALQRFYWSSIREDCNNWVSKCDECAKVKHPPRKPHAPLGEMPVGVPSDRLPTDILGSFPESTWGNKYVLAVTDYFTKWVEILAIPDQSAATCAEIILNEVIARFGCPYDIHSDQGHNYGSALFSELCQLLEICKTRTTPGHPHCNGQVEHFNRTLVGMIKSYLRGQQHNWDQHLGCLAAAYWATPHKSTGMTLNLLMFGREVRMPIEVMLGPSRAPTDEEVTSYGGYVETLREQMQRAHDVAWKHLGKNAICTKEHYDAKCTLTRYKHGDLVWYATNIKQLHLAPKLRVPFEGPYLILEKISDLDYCIQLDAKVKKSSTP